MKKTALIMSVLALPVVLSGCANKPDPSDFDPPAHVEQKTEKQENAGGAHELGTRIVLPIPGVTRHLRAPFTGTYTLEYAHFPFGSAETDATLDISDGNNYVLTLSKDGASVTHSGKWYSNKGSITFFFDEPRTNSVPDAYYPDSAYADIADGGKIMLYELGGVLVLSKNAT